MGLFDGKSHIKNTKDLDKALKKEGYLTKNERRFVKEKAEKLVKGGSGMSKEEWRKKIISPMQKNSKDSIDSGEASKLKKFGK